MSSTNPALQQERDTYGRFTNRGTRFGYLAITPVDGVADQLDRGEPLLDLDSAKARLATLDGALGPRIVVVTQSIAWGEVEL
jgi:hypothetical protein